MLTKRISVSHLCHCGGDSFPLRVQRRSSHTWADGRMNLVERATTQKTESLFIPFILHLTLNREPVRSNEKTGNAVSLCQYGENRRLSSFWYLENWRGFSSAEPMAFRKFGTTLAPLSLYLTLLSLNIDNCPALKIVDRCLCKQRVAGLKSGLQVP